MSDLFYHKEITDAQWEKIKFLFSESVGRGRPPLNPRIVLNAIIWIMKSGGRWRDLPPEFGNGNSIYHKFRQWCKQGLFKRLLNLFNDAGTDLLEIDSTFCKVPQSACSSSKNQAIGSSRGGKNTKIHVLQSNLMYKTTRELGIFEEKRLLALREVGKHKQRCCALRRLTSGECYGFATLNPCTLPRRQTATLRLPTPNPAPPPIKHPVRKPNTLLKTVG